jgi:hypothetical protein
LIGNFLAPKELAENITTSDNDSDSIIVRREGMICFLGLPGQAE